MALNNFESAHQNRESGKALENDKEQHSSMSGWEQISQDLHVQARLAGDSSDKKIGRVGYVVAKGIYEGAADEIAQIAEHPAVVLKSVAIGLGQTALLCTNAGRYAAVVLPIMAGLTAATDVVPHAKDIKNAISDAWKSNNNLAEDGKLLRPIGEFTVDYGIAKLSAAASMRGVYRATQTLSSESFKTPVKPIDINEELIASLRQVQRPEARLNHSYDK